MREETKLNLFKKIITGKDIEKELRIRKRNDHFETIPNKNVAEFDDRISDGWIVDKEFKTSKKLKKSKHHDILFEDKVWALFASLGFKFLNKDRKNSTSLMTKTMIL